MPQEILRQSNFNNGELDPRMRGRRDVKIYFASAAHLENVVTTPSGEINRRPGSTFIDKVRRQLSEISVSGATFEAPNGGSAAGLVEGGAPLVTTTELQQVDPYVLVNVTLSGTPNVALVDLIDYAAQGEADAAEAPFQYPWDQAAAAAGAVKPTEFGAIKVQYRVGGDWHDFGAPAALGSILRTRRFGIGPRRAINSRYWRVVKVGALDWNAAVARLGRIRFWSEGAALSPVRVWPFSFDDKAQRYFLAVTDRNIEVYHADGRAASIAVPHEGAIVAQLRRAQVLDTLIEFHTTTPPNRITRQGAHTEWDSRPVAFASLPKFDYTGDRAGSVDEVQQLRFTDYNEGDTFVITLEEETTSVIAYGPTPEITGDRILAALEALANVGEGNVTVTPNGDFFEVTFTGAAGGVDVGEMAPRTLVSAAGGVFATTAIPGAEGGEPIISAARGWPACGTFHQSRLWMGGLASRPQTALASRLGDWFNFASSGTLKAISIDLNTDETTTITAFFPGQHLQLFTSSAEFFFPVEPIVPPPPVKRATKRGLAEGSPLADMDGATVFITAGGGALAEFIYDDSRQTYVAGFLSKWATHLLAGTEGAPCLVTDFGFRRALTPIEADRAILIRDDGMAAVMHALRSEDVIGFVRWTTAGAYLASGADLAGDQYLAVRRTVGGQDDIYIEKVDAGAMLDSQVKVVGPGDGPVTGLGHLEGRAVAIYIDGADAGDGVVVGGAVARPYPALRETSVGLLFEPRIVTLPAVQEQDPRPGSSMSVGVGSIDLRLGPTANLKGGLVDGRKFPFPLKRRPNVLADQGPGEAPFDGWTRLFPLSGFRRDAQAELVQTRPGPLSIQEVVLTVTS